MIYLAGQIWPALTAAAAIGLVVGFAAFARTPVPRTARTASVLVLVTLAAAAVLSASAAIRGRPGLWLDMAVMLVLAYLAGCVVGWALRAAIGFVRRPNARSVP